MSYTLCVARQSQPSKIPFEIKKNKTVFGCAGTKTALKAGFISLAEGR